MDNLIRAINQTKDKIKEHLESRPNPYSIIARTKWAQDHDTLVRQLERLENQFRSGLTGTVQYYKELPPEEAALSAEYQHLSNLMDRLVKEGDRARSAKTHEEFLRVRQTSYWMRGEIVTYAKKHRLPVPAFPPVPSDPWRTNAYTGKPSMIATGCSG